MLPYRDIIYNIDFVSDGNNLDHPISSILNLDNCFWKTNQKIN